MKHRFRLLNFALIFTLAFTLFIPRAAAAAQGSDAPAHPAKTELHDPRELEAFLDELLAQQLAEQHLAGAAVAVVKDGKLFFSKGYGFADLARKQAVTPGRTLLPTGSTCKLFVWTAVMQLVEQGRLDLNRDVNDYLDFTIPATYDRPVTLNDLMSHSAGFEDQFYFYSPNAAEIQPLGAYLRAHLPDRVSAPGARTGYSNYGTALAAYIVERVSGMAYDQYVQQFIFAPLKMTHTTVTQPFPAGLAADRAVSYEYRAGGFEEVAPVSIHIGPAGSGYATAEDMARFMIAHLQDGAFETARILQPDTARQMHTRSFTLDPRVNGFAHGFAESTVNNLRVLRHEGSLPPVGCSALMLLPEKQVGFYVAYNTACAMTTGLPVWQAFLDHYYPAESGESAPAAVVAEDGSRLAGVYRSTRRSYTTFGKIAVLVENGQDVRVSTGADGTLTTAGLGGQPLTWAAAADNTYLPAEEAARFYSGLVFRPQEGLLLVKNNPYRVYERIAWYETAPFSLALLAACGLVWLLALISAGVGALRRGRRPAGRARLAARLAGAAAGLLAVFGAGLFLTLSDAVLFGPSPLLAVVLTLPLLAGLAALGSLAAAITAWPDPAWGRFSRVRWAAVLAGVVIFMGWLAQWNLLGYRF